MVESAYTGASKASARRACGFESRSRHALSVRGALRLLRWPLGGRSPCQPRGPSPLEPHGPGRRLLVGVRARLRRVRMERPGAHRPGRAAPARTGRTSPGHTDPAGPGHTGPAGTPAAHGPDRPGPHRPGRPPGGARAGPRGAGGWKRCGRACHLGRVHMTPEEFREYGREVVDWIADYWERVGSLPVAARVRARGGRRAAALVGARAGRAVLGGAGRPRPGRAAGVTHWQHPAFFAYFPANASGPAVLGGPAVVGARGAGHAVGDLARRRPSWRRSCWTGWPSCSTCRSGSVRAPAAGSSRTPRPRRCCAPLLAALHRARGGPVRTGGVRRPVRRVPLAPRRTRPSRRRSRIAGLGDAAIRVLDVDPSSLSVHRGLAARRGRGRPGRRASAAVRGGHRRHHLDHRDRPGAGRSARSAGPSGIWLHVDAAYAGVAAVCPELRWLNDGLELADSYATNPHKWLLTNFDCDAFWVADPDALVGALSVLPEFLRNARDRVRRGDRLPGLAGAARAGGSGR